jgi:heat shock protein HtpX
MSGHSPLILVGTAILGLGIGSLIKLVRSHPQGSFPERSVESLVSEIKVSGVRSVPCTVEGKIIGRGVPGLYWSEDLVLQDGSGFIVLDYNQPIGFLNFLFGAFRAESLIGQQARAIGWFRRAPRPYVELLRVEFTDQPTQRCWIYTGALVISAITILVGALLIAATYLMI